MILDFRESDDERERPIEKKQTKETSTNQSIETETEKEGDSERERERERARVSVCEREKETETEPERHRDTKTDRERAYMWEDGLCVVEQETPGFPGIYERPKPGQHREHKDMRTCLSPSNDTCYAHN